MAVLCPMGANIVCKNQEGNELISNAIKKYPERFIGFASVNPWFGKEAIYELKKKHQRFRFIWSKTSSSNARISSE